MMQFYSKERHRTTAMAILALAATILWGVSAADASSFFDEGPSAIEQHYKQLEAQKLQAMMGGLDEAMQMMLMRPFWEGNCDKFADTEADAHRGSGEAQWVLANLYGSGLCVNQDESRAVTWMEKAASSGYKGAFLKLGKVFYQGRGVVQSSEKALAWLEKAANSGVVEAHGLIALIYLDPSSGLENYNKAELSARRGAQLDDPLSQYILAALLSDEEIGLYDPVQALKWAILAAGSTDENARQMALEAKANIAETLSGDQVRDAQQRAADFRAAMQGERIEPELPQVAEDLADKLSQEQADTELRKLGVGRDRFMFSESIVQDNLGLFKLFVAAGASIESEHRYGGTPLFWAARTDSPKVFEYLLEHRAQVNVERDGDTPLSNALFRRNLDMAKALLDRGADASAPGVVHAAVRFDDVKLLEKLVARGSSINAQWGEVTPLSSAIRDAQFEGDSTVSYCHPHAARFLLERGASVDWKDKFGDTLLIKSMAAENPLPCVKALLEHGADVQQAGTSGQSPLLNAVWLGNPDIVRVLIQHGANISEEYAFARKQLPMSSDSSVAEVLMGKGTPLMVAVAQGHVSVAQVLLEAGADPQKRNETGLSALSLARKTGNEAMIDLLSHEKP